MCRKEFLILIFSDLGQAMFDCNCISLVPSVCIQKPCYKGDPCVCVLLEIVANVVRQELPQIYVKIQQLVRSTISDVYRLRASPLHGMTANALQDTK